MTTFLFFISFLLNIVCLLAVIILYTRQNRFIDLEKRQGKMIQEMEETISTYLIEMKEENEAFIKSMHSSKKGFSVQENISEPQTKYESSETPHPASMANNRLNASKAYKRPAFEKENDDRGWTPLVPDDNGVHEEKSLIAQVLTLQKNGLSIEEIAKRLGKGKTEIELLLKFNQKT